MRTQEQFIKEMAVYDCIPLENYVQSATRIQFRCTRCNQDFIASRNKMKMNRRPGQPGCTSCFRWLAKEARADKWTEVMSTYCAERGGELVTRRLTQIKDRATFRCAKGHEWEASAEAVKNLRTWCPHCAGQTLRTLDELRRIAESRGGFLLSTEYVNVDATYQFECVLGHRFSNMFKKVERGQWCPTCNKGRISEEISRTTMEQLFSAPFPKERPKWLRNSRGRLMELDGANFDLGLAFEYHGAQHFQKNYYVKEDAKLLQRQEDDNYKEELCRQHGIKLVILTHKMQYGEFPKHIKAQLEQFGYDVSSIDFERPIDLARAYVRNDRLGELRELLAPKQIEVLTSAWQGVNALYKLHCFICDHKWEARANMFFNSRRVAGCNQCSRRDAGERQRLTIDVLHAFAEKHGGKLLSDVYTQRRANYLWRCSAGHEFEGNYNNMKFRNQFCPKCEGRTTRRKEGAT